MQDIESIKRYLTDYFSEGIKESGDYNIGVELEHFVVEKDSLKSVSYYSDSGVGQVLRELLPHFPYSYFEEDEILGLANDDYSITLEPGSQLEISIIPQTTVKAIETIYNGFLETIEDVLARKGYIFSTLGYLPVTSISEIKLLPKKRYEFMDRHFQKSGTMGRNMMRGTSSCQISIDYYNEADCIRKIRCAYLLSPIISYLSSNSPVFEGKPNTNPLLRTLIWRNTDNARSGIIPGLFDDDFGFEKYAEYVLHTPAIFQVKDGDFSETNLSALEVMLESDDIPEPAELYISLMFPDIRLKQYVEIRIADSMPIDKVLGYAAFIKGLFCCIDELEAVFKNTYFNEKSILEAQDNLMAGNLFVYGEQLDSMLEKLIRVAECSLDEDEQAYLKSFIAVGE